MGLSLSLTLLHASNKGADQPARRRSLISASVFAPCKVQYLN